jgi:hypothetical protein
LQRACRAGPARNRQATRRFGERSARRGPLAKDGRARLDLNGRSLSQTRVLFLLIIGAVSWLGPVALGPELGEDGFRLVGAIDFVQLVGQKDIGAPAFP